MKTNKPKIVCLCGSTRFKSEYAKANEKETLKGNIVLSCGLWNYSGKMSDETKIKLDELHKRKIDLADEILIINPGGYIGDSTKSEIIYAEKHNKPIRYTKHKDAFNQKRFDKLCNIRSKIHKKIKNLILKTVLGKTNLCALDKTAQVYAKLQLLINKDRKYWLEQKNMSK